MIKTFAPESRRKTPDAPIDVIQISIASFQDQTLIGAPRAEAGG